MADEEQEAGAQVGPGLGQLYAAWQADGFPVLRLRPGSAVDWQPERPWRVQLSFDPTGSAIALKVEQSPFSPDTSEMANILVLTAAAVTRVEDSPRVRDHLSRPVEAPSSGPVQRWSMALAGLAVLAIGAGVWLFFSTSEPNAQGAELRTQKMAMLLIDPEEPHWVHLEQTPPCLEEQAEYKGGCYLPVVRRERTPQSARP